jgi:hypothetical protein
MKIIVYNSHDQYALSRGQVESLKEILPKEYFEPIKEFHITHTINGSEVFEYDQKTKVVYFAYPVKEKTPETTRIAVDNLLIGLARIKSNTLWGKPTKPLGLKEYKEFISSWQQKCLNALSKKP